MPNFAETTKLADGRSIKEHLGEILNAFIAANKEQEPQMRFTAICEFPHKDNPETFDLMTVANLPSEELVGYLHFISHVVEHKASAEFMDGKLIQPNGGNA